MTRFTITLWQIYIPDMDFWTYFCYQKEACPTTGKIHWQAYGETLGRRKFSTIVRHFKLMETPPHILECRGTPQENRNYCKKTETSIGDFEEFGKISPEPEPGKRTDIDMFAMAILSGDSTQELSIKFPGMVLKYHNHIYHLRLIRALDFAQKIRPIEVIWLWGEPGTGKSRAAFSYALEQKHFDQPLFSNSSVWFENYNCAELLLLDELKPSTVPAQLLNRLLDRYPLPIAYKGSSTYACWHKVLITSNYHPDGFSCLGLSRRCRVIKVELHKPTVIQFGPNPDEPEMHLPSAEIET